MADNYPTLTHDQAKARAAATPGRNIVYRTPDGEAHMYLVSAIGAEPQYTRVTSLDDKQGG